MRTNIGKEGKKDHIRARTHESRHDGFPFSQHFYTLFLVCFPIFFVNLHIII